MKSWTGIAAGLLLILIACIVELTNQATPATPEVQVLGLDVRLTPFPTPPHTPTLVPTPTPVHVRHFLPTDHELIELVAQSLPRDRDLVRSATNVQVQRHQLARGERMLLVMGESPVRETGEPRKPAGFAAVLKWQNAEYIVTFSHARSGRDHVRVSMWLDPNIATFRFDEVSNVRCVGSGDCEPPLITHACNVPLNQEALWAIHRNRQNPMEWGCF